MAGKWRHKTDYTTPKFLLDPYLLIKVTYRSECANGINDKVNGIQICTDDSRSLGKVECDFKSSQGNLKLSLRLSNHYGVIMTIRTGSVPGISGLDILIFTVS